jgi:hypothetical protein
MPTILPPRAVDALPEGLWSSGNLYRLFGQDLHFCVGGYGSTSVRTIEINGGEVAHGARPFEDFIDAPSTDAQLRRWQLDLGWILVGATAIAVLAVAALGRNLRRLT